MRILKALVIAIVCMLSLTGCSYAPLLKAREYLLHSQTIRGNKAIPKEQLTPLYQQLPNRRFAALGLKTYLHLYLIGRESFDTAKVNKEIAQTHAKYSQKMQSIVLDTVKLLQIEAECEVKIKTLQQQKQGLKASDTAAIQSRINKTQASCLHRSQEVYKDTLKRAKVRKKYAKKISALETKRLEGNYMMRVMGEPPSLFDTNVVNDTKEQFKAYYASKGYLFTEISHKADTTGKNVSVTYNIVENPPLVITDIVYEIRDSAVRKIYDADSARSFLKKGMVYNEEIFNKERERTFKLLRDHGFYYFAKNYIFMDLDSTGHKNQAVLYYIIKDPEEGRHKQYFIKDVVINIDKSKNSTDPHTYLYNQKVYNLYYKKYSRKILDSKIPIKKGAPFSARQTQRAQNRLSQLQMFKYVNISYAVAEDSLVANISTGSLSKFQVNDEFGVNTNVNRQIPGPYGSITFTNRNTFRGCEILDLNLSAGIEGQISNLDETQFISTTEINGNVGISFPLLLLPGPWRYSYLDYNPRTRFSLSYISNYRPDYDRTEIRAIMNYQLQINQSSRLIIAPLELNLINAKIKQDEFQKLLETLAAGGSNIINNFKKSLVSNMSITYINNTNSPLHNKRSHFFKTYTEIGGLTPTLLASLTNEDAQEKKLLGLPYYKYWKFGADYRYYHPIFRQSTLAIRVSSNILSTISDNGNGLPYPKFLYAGGGNSIRAWATRRLGPGSFVAKDGDKASYKIEQPGELNLESSIEGRFKIYKFVGIGLFADMGNVWTLKNDTARPGAQFKLNSFYEQIAIGTGIGLRLNFSFFVFRLDVSTKTYDPARVAGDRFRLFKLNASDLLVKNNQTTYSFGIGYPF